MAIRVTLGAELEIFHLNKERLVNRKAAIAWAKRMRHRANAILYPPQNLPLSPEPIRDLERDLEPGNHFEWGEDLNATDELLSLWTFSPATAGACSDIEGSGGDSLSGWAPGASIARE
jgi:hypothetical protein